MLVIENLVDFLPNELWSGPRNSGNRHLKEEHEYQIRDLSKKMEWRFLECCRLLRWVSQFESRGSIDWSRFFNPVAQGFGPRTLRE